MNRSNYREARVKTPGADKGYHQKKFMRGCRERGIAPHAACKGKLRLAALDGLTTQRSGYKTSQRIRKRAEGILGWKKTVGGLPRSRYRGIERMQAWAYFVGSAYNLLRIARLAAAG